MNKNGQSIIEYVLIAVLVVFGVVYMGPYVLRSVGAHFKSWDEGVHDSFEESINQAPVTDLPLINATCLCTDALGACGSSLAGSQCGPNQRVSNHTCNPQFCDQAPASSCVADPSCCTTYYPNGCGSVACPAGGCATAPTSPPPTPNNCYFGQRVWATLCSTLPIECQTDSTCLLPDCDGQYSNDPNVNLFCATNTINPPNNLTTAQSVSFVANQAACPPSSTCQLYCVPPNVLNAQQSACIPPTTSLPTCTRDNGALLASAVWTGYYADQCAQHVDNDDSGNSYGDLFYILSCDSTAHLTGICLWDAGNNQATYLRGLNHTTCSNTSTTGVGCSWSGSQITYWQNNQYNSSCYDGIGGGHNPPSPCPANGGDPRIGACTADYVSLTCTGGQLTSITMSNAVGTIPPAAVDGCNWNGVADIDDFGSGNDMYLTCTPNASGQGVFTNFEYYCGTNCT